ncbi:fatty-acid amide hydrolase 2-B [Denticeps clupeoides]|uniref:fatty-acid amide hydrolase 2-B n=1 Tax=Denticeps clupeoides TaxID=299321 RepID=UPI0010A3B77C|nr:fatty-acid amide hydrolase 2-A-like [Denticeps clupeoides]
MALSGWERLQAWIMRAGVSLLLGTLRLLGAWRPAAGPARVPPVTDPLLKLSAAKLAEKIRRREVSSVQVVQAYIDRIQEINPLVNAVVKERFSAALQEAAQADRLVEQEEGQGSLAALRQRCPLLGVPLTVKESFSLQGMPLSTGLVSRAQVVSNTDAPPVASLKRAGAIPLGVTNTSELCMWMESHNHVYGITRNPYDLERTPGGSSGGEGSVLGGGASVIGVGSDIGGSIRMPSFFSGIFGHKTTPYMVTYDGQHPPASGAHEDFISTGPMCRYAEDLLPVLEIMAGPNAHKLHLSEPVDLKKLRFFSVPHDGGSVYVPPVDKQLIQAQRQVVERLEADLGVKVQELCLPQLKYSFEIWNSYLGLPDKEGKPPQSFANALADGGAPVWPVWELVKRMLGKSSHTMAAIGVALSEKFMFSAPSHFLRQQKEALEKQLEELLGSDGVLLYPSHPYFAPKHHEPLLNPFSCAYTGIFNILGLPVTQCPLGLGREGLPLGLQVVAWRLQDRLTLATALYLEEAFGGWRDPGCSHTGQRPGC